MPLALQDLLYTALHLVIICFNLLGWIWPATRKLHLIGVLLTAASWLLLGLWYGIGYCPITDWQWQVKEQLGEQDLPASFIKYYADKLSGRDVPATLVDLVTAGSFALAAGLSVYVNFFRRAKAQK
ncbi:MAG: DUF2784 domain-containing protein [Adhaeribacter sp.]